MKPTKASIAQVAQTTKEPQDQDTVEQLLSVPIDVATLQKGYTIADPAHRFFIGIPPQTNVNEPLTVTIDIRKKNTLALDGFAVGRFYEISVLPKQSAPAQLWIILASPETITDELVMKQWREKNKSWRALSSTQRAIENKNAVSASTDGSQITIGLFRRKHERFEGIASWYDWHGAAMNVVPLGTEIRVTNPETGVSATTTIVSTGPYTENRLIDLPRAIFEKLGDLGQGLMNVVVTPLTSST